MAMKRKTLIVAAHRGEIQYFFTKHAYTKIKDIPYPLYENDLHLIFITGEDESNVKIKFKKILSIYCDRISSVINLGIAGTLKPDIARLEEIYSVSQIFKQDPSGGIDPIVIETDSKPGLRCISSIERILQSGKANTLSQFADIVDREAWSLAIIAGEFNTPIKVYKYISDIPGKQSNNEIIESASKSSEKLYSFYVNNICS